ncbi:prolyl oligopeptidase [Vulcanimicrobium alpinum]|uniref:prolyl oligopeptidase n=1 Tax=Vulcanimicrobium alpinum TaxID=3016050 RepID=A0AAN2C984_UNVUL|nr:prolyl oligopeptidase family serine peptidase [Vulcanimicrobium alpinum]BDE06044.1 prolyl oligopeptidase [Vulcanimicrobium alpinum]
MRHPRSLIAGAIVLVCTSAAGQAPVPAPQATKIPVSDTYFGTTVVDPYRWMEQNGPGLRAYLTEQGRRTRTTLDALPGRAALEARVRDLLAANESASAVMVRGDTTFFLRTPAGGNAAKLYARRDGAERLLLDPERLPGPREAIAYYLPSDDGARVAVGLAPGGSENATVRVIDVATATMLGDGSDRADFGVTAWSDDGRAFYYVKRQATDAATPANAKYLNVRAYRHVVGDDGTHDAAVFGAGIDPSIPAGPRAYAAVGLSPRASIAVGMLFDGVDRFVTVYVGDKRALARAPGAMTWRRAIVPADKVTDIAIRGTTIYALTAKDAPRFRVVRFDASRSFAQAVDAVPAGARVVEELAAGSDALYVQSREDGRSRITRVAYDGTRSEIPLPLDGTISGLEARDDRPGFVARLDSWTRPARWYAYDPGTRRAHDLQITPPAAIDTSAIVADEVTARADDGTAIPLSIVRRRDLPLDGSHPAILYAYGAYGIPVEAGFAASRMALLERGVTFAYAHVRGGGEYGEAWHLAGKGARKPVAISDYLACAHWLVERGYTAPARLVARSGSAGGIVVSGAFERAPELFAAAIEETPLSDQLRAETSASGPANVPEFGTVTTAAGFAALYATSPLHHVVHGTAYPAVLITAGVNDPRVDAWQAAKFTAALQDATSSAKPVLLRVDFDAGHGLIGSSRRQAVALTTDEFAFALWQTGDPDFQP